MRKIIIITLIFSAGTVYSQDSDNPIYKVAKKYFRSHPFDMKFSSFILSLQKDPWFTTDQSFRRTDSGFFFLSGTYRNFNPFQFVPKEIKLHISEQEIVHTDSLKTIDTIINLQLIAIADSGATGMKMVQKESKRFNSSQSRNFSNSTYNAYPSRGPITAEIYSYFIFPLTIAPLITAWGLFPDSHQYAFTITIRFKLKENLAGFILTPEELKSL